MATIGLVHCQNGSSGIALVLAWLITYLVAGPVLKERRHKEEVTSSQIPVCLGGHELLGWSGEGKGWSGSLVPLYAYSVLAQQPIKRLDHSFLYAALPIGK